MKGFKKRKITAIIEELRESLGLLEWELLIFQHGRGEEEALPVFTLRVPEKAAGEGWGKSVWLASSSQFPRKVRNLEEIESIRIQTEPELKKDISLKLARIRKKEITDIKRIVSKCRREGAKAPS